MAHRESLTVTTPRRGYFLVPPDEEEDASLLHSPRTPELRRFEDDTRSRPVPPTPSTTAFLERKPYREEHIVSLQSVALAVALAFSILLLLVYFGHETPSNYPHLSNGPPTSPALTQPLASTPSPPINPNAFPFSPSDLAAQCHAWYSLEKTPEHVHDYFWEGEHDPVEMAAWEEQQEEEVCDSTLTYVLDGEFGLFYHLTALAQAYAFALHSNRSFFIDDTLWDRGEWEDHFIPLPAQGCTRPRAEKMRSCPRGTRHWVMGSQTLAYHFGHAYQMTFEDPRAANVQRRRPMFDLSRIGFEEVLVPSATNAALIELAEEALEGDSEEEDEGVGSYVGVHLRRGDRKPMSWKWRGSYVPIEEYVSAINKSWTHHLSHDLFLPPFPTIYLATDSSTALKLLSSSLPPEWYTLTLATIPHPTLSSLAPTTPYNQPTFSTLPLSYRIALTRGMMVDFSLLVGGWGSGIDSATEEEYEAVGMGEKEYRRRRKVVAVVCALASDVCKLAAVGLGWEMGVEKGRWVNVDGAEDFDWRPTEIM